MSVAKVVLDLVVVERHVDHDFADAVAGQMLDQVLEHRLVQNRHHRFGQVLGQRAHPRTLTCRQDHSLCQNTLLEGSSVSQFDNQRAQHRDAGDAGGRGIRLPGTHPAYLIPAKQITGVHPVFHIANFIRQAIGQDDVRLAFERIEIAHHARPIELVLIQGRLVNSSKAGS